MLEKSQRFGLSQFFKIFFLPVLILLTYSMGAAQQPYDKRKDSFRCEIALVTSQKTPPKILGEFYVYNSEGEDEFISRHLPGSHLYIIGRAFLDDYFGLALELSVSQNRRGNKEKSRYYAFSSSGNMSSHGRLALSIQMGGVKRTGSMICSLPEKDK